MKKDNSLVILQGYLLEDIYIGDSYTGKQKPIFIKKVLTKEKAHKYLQEYSLLENTLKIHPYKKKLHDFTSGSNEPRIRVRIKPQ